MCNARLQARTLSDWCRQGLIRVCDILLSVAFIILEIKYLGENAKCSPPASPPSSPPRWPIVLAPNAAMGSVVPR